MWKGCKCCRNIVVWDWGIQSIVLPCKQSKGRQHQTANEHAQIYNLLEMFINHFWKGRRVSCFHSTRVDVCNLKWREQIWDGDPVGGPRVSYPGAFLKQNCHLVPFNALQRQKVCSSKLFCNDPQGYVFSGRESLTVSKGRRLHQRQGTHSKSLFNLVKTF